MIDALATHLALRNRALTAVAATTGTMSLSATTTGYARASGSFLTDGFAPGMEVLAAGFATTGNNGRGVISSVTATTMTVQKIKLSTVSSSDTTPTIVADVANTADAAASGCSIIAGLPILRGYENTPIAPSPLAPYNEEEFVPATAPLISGPAQGGIVEETGLYVWKLYGLSGKGVSAIRKYADAIKAKFTPGTNLTAGSNTVSVRGDTSTQTSQIIPLTSGWSAITITIPWRSYSTNQIAA